jgi:peptidoglycan/xylan/chitin deacetylase (PgdA/CDA1 family)
MLAGCATAVGTESSGQNNVPVPPSGFQVPTSDSLTPTAPAQAPAQAPANTPVIQPIAVQASARVRPVIRTGPKPARGKVIYLTFDDGPSKYTPQMLDLLKGYNAKATFFVVGGQVRTREKFVRRAAAEGHAIGNHSWNHANFTRLRNSQITYQLVHTNRAIRAAGAKQPTCMRPPYGAFDLDVRRTAAQQRQRVVMWSLDSNDWRRPGAGSIARRVIAGARNGSIVLMHDGGGNRSQSVAATRQILRTLGRQGYRFESLPVCR